MLNSKKILLLLLLGITLINFVSSNSITFVVNPAEPNKNIEYNLSIETPYFLKLSATIRSLVPCVQE